MNIIDRVIYWPRGWQPEKAQFQLDFGFCAEENSIVGLSSNISR